jgi:hypothetical protein
MKKFVSEPQPPPQEVEIPEEGKTKAKERREVGEGDDTVIVEDTSDDTSAWMDQKLPGGMKKPAVGGPLFLIFVWSS